VKGIKNELFKYPGTLSQHAENEYKMKKEETSKSLKYILPDNCSETEKEANPIAAEEIVEAIKCGNNIEIINRVIEGPFILKHINVEGKITIQKTNIKCQVDWSYATFKQVLNLENSTFKKDATFTGIIVENDIVQDNVTFEGKATFSNITVNGVFHSRDSTFIKEAIFVESIFKKRVEFSKSIFEGDVDFGITLIGSDALFNNAKFKQMANFHSVRIKMKAGFNSTIFKDKAIFNQAQIEGSAFFDTAIFEDEADFGSARIGGAAVFNGAKFKKLVNFNCAKINGAVFFNKALFRWDKIPGSDNAGLIDYITKNFGICWRSNDTIEKTDDKTIKVSVDKNTLSLSINNEKTKVKLLIDDGRTDELFVILENYLFSWEEILEKSVIFTNFLKSNYDVDWAKKAKIAETDNGKTIIITDGKNVLSLNLNNENTELNIKIDNGKTDKFIVKTENGNKNIYENSNINIYKKTIFEDEVDFGSTQIGNTAEFSVTEFKKKVSFSRTNIEGDAFFEQSSFEDETIFNAARIAGNAQFNNAIFKKKAEFSMAIIGDSAKFHSAIFNGKIDFSGAIIGITAEFNNAKFNHEAIFNSAKIDGAVFFKSAIFEGDFDLIGVQIGLAAEFQQATFKQMAKFSNAHIKEYLKLKSTIFNDKVEIEHAQIEKAISLNGAYFANDVSFKHTSLGTFYFEKDDEDTVPQIKKLHIQPNVKIDLRGCIYDNIDPTDFWKELIMHFNPYDRQPFSQLEGTFRRAGKDNLADNVYYKGRIREFSENYIKIFTWINRFFKYLMFLMPSLIVELIILIDRLLRLLLDIFLWFFTGYGVKIKRLLILIVFLLSDWSIYL